MVVLYLSKSGQFSLLIPPIVENLFDSNKIQRILKWIVRVGLHAVGFYQLVDTFVFGFAINRVNGLDHWPESPFAYFLQVDVPLVEVRWRQSFFRSSSLLQIIIISGLQLSQILK